MPDGQRPTEAELCRDVYAEIVAPLIQNMRDAQRYVTAVRGTATALRDEVEVADILGLEAVRLFLPDVFHHLHGAVDALTFAADSGARERSVRRRRRGGLSPDPVVQEQLRRLIDAGNQRPDVAEAMLKQLFPYGLQYRDADPKADWLEDAASQGALAKRRVADESNLRLYLERVADQDLESLRGAESALSVMADGESLDAFLRDLPPHRQVTVVRDLCKLDQL